jgi:hypothetical protein
MTEATWREREQMMSTLDHAGFEVRTGRIAALRLVALGRDGAVSVREAVGSPLLDPMLRNGIAKFEHATPGHA